MFKREKRKGETCQTKLIDFNTWEFLICRNDLRKNYHKLIKDDLRKKSLKFV